MRSVNAAHDQGLRKHQRTRFAIALGKTWCAPVDRSRSESNRVDSDERGNGPVKRVVGTKKRAKIPRNTVNGEQKSVRRIWCLTAALGSYLRSAMWNDRLLPVMQDNDEKDGPPEVGDILEVTANFLRQRDGYVTALRAELDLALARVAAITGRLAELVPERSTRSAKPADPEPREQGSEAKLNGSAAYSAPSADATINDLIVYVLAQFKRRMKAGEIVKAVVQLRSDAKPTTIFPAIYRLAEKGTIRQTGSREERTAMYVSAPCLTG